MNTKIAENIRKLRKQKDITQEELSRFLGVSYQAVSKWERGEGFPDITLLPSLANFFKVSIDDLFGMNQLNNQNYLTEVYTKEHKYVEQGKYDKAIMLIRKALKMFPGNYSLMSELAIALSFKEDEDSIKEAVTLCEHVIENSTSEKVRSTTKTLMCFLYRCLGEDEKAIDIAKRLPHFWESRELILPNMIEYPANIETMSETIKVILSALCERYKCIEDGNNDLEYRRMISIGLASYDSSSYSREAIFEFLDKIYS